MIKSRLSHHITLVLLSCLLFLTFLALTEAQCTFQGSLARRDGLGVQMCPGDLVVEEKRTIIGHERARDLAKAQVKKRACNSDNVLRALINHSVSATPFCIAFISVPTVTKAQSVAGVTPTVVTATGLVEPSYYPNGNHIEAVSIPAIVESYPATRISSACSCLSIPTQTTTTTYSSSTER